MAILVGLAPWIVYWILVGNTSFFVAAGIPLALMVATSVTSVVKKRRLQLLDIGGLIFFAAAFITGIFVDDDAIERWMNPASNAAIFLIALVSVLIGRPFVRDFAIKTVPAEVATSDRFLKVTDRLTWVWIAAFAVMTISAAIPPIVDGAATIRDDANPLSILFYWVIPYAAMGLAAVASAEYPKAAARHKSAA